MKFKLLFIAFYFIQLSVFSQILLDSSSAYKYFKGTENPSINTAWHSVNLDDSNWLNGKSPFWYGDGSDGTLLSDMEYNYSSSLWSKQ